MNSSLKRNKNSKSSKSNIENRPKLTSNKENAQQQPALSS